MFLSSISHSLKYPANNYMIFTNSFFICANYVAQSSFVARFISFCRFFCYIHSYPVKNFSKKCGNSFFRNLRNYFVKIIFSQLRIRHNSTFFIYGLQLQGEKYAVGRIFLLIHFQGYSELLFIILDFLFHHVSIYKDIFIYPAHHM